MFPFVKIAAVLLLLPVLSPAAPAEAQGFQEQDSSPAFFEIDTQLPLGLIEASAPDPEAVGLQDYGLTTKVKQKLTFNGVKSSGVLNIFPDKTPEIFWFAQFTIKGSIQNNVSRKYRIAWYAPDGKIFHEQRFKSSLINETFVKTPLKLPQPLPEELIGRWRVTVWKKDLLIDDRYFEIVRTSR